MAAATTKTTPAAETKKAPAKDPAVMSLAQKFVELRRACPEIVKKKHSDGVKYTFAKIFDVYELLAPAILATLAAPASDNEAAWEKYTKLWDKVWADEVCKAYRRQGDADHWLWNHAFYNADIGTLNYIADLIGARR